jgi:dTDP-4-amino-4,6-dideoxygalactose transaminase
MSDDVPAYYGGDPIRDDILGYGSQSITNHEKEAVVEALQGPYITRGPTVETFEERVADFVGVDHAIATSSGTTALHLAARTAGFTEGDEVITTPLTFAATAFAAVYCNARPVFADIDPERRTLDPVAVRERITEDTEGIVPMHYGGHPAEIDGLLSIADKNDLTVIWDACHAFGGSWRGEGIGAQKDMAVFSFHPVKNITTGEGGMIVTDDSELADRARSLRTFDMNYDPSGHDAETWYQVVEGAGFNYNITDFQAALGLAQMDRIDIFKQRRDAIIKRYDDAFDDLSGLTTPPDITDADPMYHLYAVEIGDGFGCDRTEFVNAMHAENIGVQVHYVPLHYHPYFQNTFGYERGMFPKAERVYDRIVSLPLHPEMDATDVSDVIDSVVALHNYNR